MSKESSVDSKKEEFEELVKREKELDEVLKKSTAKYEMSLLHKYNEVKDAAQIILGAIANIECVTIKELHERFQLPLSD